MKYLIIVLSVALFMCSRNPIMIDVTPPENPVPVVTPPTIIPSIKYDSIKITIEYHPIDTITRTPCQGIPGCDTVLDHWGSDSCKVYANGRLIGGIWRDSTKTFTVQKYDTLISKWVIKTGSPEFHRSRTLYALYRSTDMRDTIIAITDTQKRIGR